MNTHVDRERGEESVPDVSLVSESIAGRCKWEMWEELNSDQILLNAQKNVIKREKKCITGIYTRRK